MKYDPLKPPDPKAWQALEEMEQIELVRAYHRKAGVRLPNPLLHATIHATVESQAALGDATPVQRTLERLQREGLDRHEAVHAVGSVLASYVHDVIRSPPSAADPNAGYYDQLGSLTAARWRQQFADDSQTE